MADVVELQRANDRHKVLLAAIENGDPAAAVEATRTHLAETVALFTSETRHSRTAERNP